MTRPLIHRRVNTLALAFADAVGDVVAGALVGAHAHDRDRPEGGVTQLGDRRRDMGPVPNRRTGHTAGPLTEVVLRDLPGSYFWNETIRSGRLISHEHPTQSQVKIIQQPDGSRVLRIENLETTNGPDLRLWLSSAPVLAGPDGWFVFKSHDHLELGALKANQGNQNYSIPAQADLNEFSSVTIWCKRFRVSFGAAELTAP